MFKQYLYSYGYQDDAAEDREDTRSEEAKEEERSYQVKVDSAKPGVDTEARWVVKCKKFRYGYK